MPWPKSPHINFVGGNRLHVPLHNVNGWIALAAQPQRPEAVWLGASNAHLVVRLARVMTTNPTPTIDERSIPSMTLLKDLTTSASLDLHSVSVATKDKRSGAGVVAGDGSVGLEFSSSIHCVGSIHHQNAAVNRYFRKIRVGQKAQACDLGCAGDYSRTLLLLAKSNL